MNRRLACLAFCMLLTCTASAAGGTATGTAATAPTADRLSAEQIDDIWRRSVSKFDAERARVLARVRAGVAAGPYTTDWASLQHYTEPDWYTDAKFGIFVHWGVFSVPRFGSEWYSRLMYQQGSKEFAHHVATYGPQARVGYKDLIPQFKGEQFDPAGWAQLFKNAGARYVVPVAEHHDGFAMYRTKLSDWSAATMGPKRDVLGELATAIRAEGLHFGASSHRAEHDWFFDGGRHVDSDVNDPKYASLYGPAHLRNVTDDDADVPHDWTYASQAWLDDWLARTAELLDNYQPELLYFDWWIGHPTFRNALATFAAYDYNRGAKTGQRPVLIYKLNAMPDGAGTFDVERGALPGIHARHWQTDTSISNASWGYIDGDTYKPARELLHQLIDVVSKNGNLMLNVGPRPDGTIPEEAQRILLDIGAWLRHNGEAIYGTRPWTTYGEGPTEAAAGTFKDRDARPYTPDDVRFTTRPGVLYAIELGRPTGAGTGTGGAISPAISPAKGTGAAINPATSPATSPATATAVVIHSVTPAAARVADVTLLSTGETLVWTQGADGLHLQLPATAPDAPAYTYRIRLQ